MDDLSKHDPQARFTGRAALYACARPDYPGPAVDFIVGHCKLYSGSVLVDMGSGTGISSRLFARKGMKVIGVEPNEEMRKKAEDYPHTGEFQKPEYLEGSAESSGLSDACCHSVLAAQAFHWFQLSRALVEFHRILKPGGWVCLMANERDESDRFTREYGELMRTLPDTSVIEASRGQAGNALLSSDLYESAEMKTFENKQVLDSDGLLGRAFSTSYAPEPKTREADSFAVELSGLYKRHESDNQVVMKYLTFVYLARKPQDLRELEASVRDR